MPFQKTGKKKFKIYQNARTNNNSRTSKNRNIAIGQSLVLIEKAVHRDIYNLFRSEIADAPTVEKNN